jgi:DMSO/TMAO reductase YedYZ molybdopterin-dependent catalytic subunit
MTGEIAREMRLSRADLAAIDPRYQVDDVSALDAKRRGRAVTLAGLLAVVDVKPTARYLTLNSTADDFHASIPLAAVRDRALLIYELDGAPLPPKAGGPLRFFIPDYDACRSAEIDECANVKFVDHIELSQARGYDNRPRDEADHADLHQRQSGGSG